MASSLVVTNTEGEDQEFDFNKWIIDNQLGALKEVFIRLNMTTSSTLNTISTEFGKLMRDPQLLTKAHLIPTVMDALNKVPQTAHSKPKLVLVCFEEQESINKLIKYDNDISTLIKQLNESNNDGIKFIQDLRCKIDFEFNTIKNKLENRHKTIQNLLIDIEKQQKLQFTVKWKELNKKQLNIKSVLKSCYSLIENENIDSVKRKKEIIFITKHIEDNDIKFNVENDDKINVNFDSKNSLIEHINKLGVISIISSIKEKNKCKIFKYESDLDRNGIIYYLGTKYIDSKNEWINPYNIVNISATTLEKGNVLSQFMERKCIKRFKTKNIKNSFFIIDFNMIKIKPNYYTLRHSSPYGYYLRFWSFQGFNIDNNKWETIKQHVNDTQFNNKNKIISFPLNCNGFYSKFRIVQNKENSGDHFGLSGPDFTLCCSGFELYGEAIFPMRV